MNTKTNYLLLGLQCSGIKPRGDPRLDRSMTGHSEFMHTDSKISGGLPISTITRLKIVESLYTKIAAGRVDEMDSSANTVTLRLKGYTIHQSSS